MGCGCLLGVFTMLVRGSILMALSIHNRGSVWYGVLLRVSVGSCVLQRGGCALILTIVEMSNELEVSHSAGVPVGTCTRVVTCVLDSLFGMFSSPSTSTVGCLAICALATFWSSSASCCPSFSEAVEIGVVWASSDCASNEFNEF